MYRCAVVLRVHRFVSAIILNWCCIIDIDYCIHVVRLILLVLSNHCMRASIYHCVQIKKLPAFAENAPTSCHKDGCYAVRVMVGIIALVPVYHGPRPRWMIMSIVV